MATNVLPPLSIGNITTFQGFTTTEAAKVHSPPSSLSKGRSGAHAHRLGGKGEGRGGRHGSGEVDALKEKGQQKKSLLRDLDPARFVLALDVICRGHLTCLYNYFICVMDVFMGCGFTSRGQESGSCLAQPCTKYGL